MLDSDFLIKNWETVAPKLLSRGASQESLDRFQMLYRERRTAVTEAGKRLADINALSQEIGLRKRSREDVAPLLQKATALKAEVDAFTAIASQKDADFSRSRETFPNLT